MSAPAQQALQHHVLHDLLLRCARRDEAALAEYYQLTSPFLNAVLGRRLDSSRDVEDVLVRLYVAIWRRAGSYVDAPDTSVWAWTLMIMEQSLVETTTTHGAETQKSRV